MPATPELCVIVLSYANEGTIVGVVDSLLAQTEPLEIVVSHSGGGPTPRLLESRRSAIRLECASKRRCPGAARNAGIAASQAPFVAFLAGDCVATAGWAAGRLARHRAGAPAVASALAPLEPSWCSLASFLLEHSYRMPHLANPSSFRSPLRDRAMLWLAGLSYTREVLDRHGPFPEGFAIDEDTALNQRLHAAGVPVSWAPEVVTRHAYPTSLATMLSDRYRRGRLKGSVQASATWRALFAARALVEPPVVLWRATRPGSPLRWRQLCALTPLLALGALATAAGRVRGGLGASASAVQFERARRSRSLSLRTPIRAPLPPISGERRDDEPSSSDASA